MIPRAESKPVLTDDGSCKPPVGQPTNDLRPTDFLRCLIPEELEPPSDALTYQKTTPTDGYTMDAVGAIRANDVPALRYLLNHGHSFNACNANGEYLIHLACRRAQPETVEFLINEAKVNVNVRDIMGRTILHDICWKSFPDLVLMSAVLKLVQPGLFLAKDIRGHTPFDYARKQHWKKWVDFLRDNQGLIQQKLYDQ